jgi:hypothetical protein
MGKKSSKLMRVDSKFFNKVFNISDRTGVPGTKVTERIAGMDWDIDVNVIKAKKKGGFRLFR